VVAGNLSERVLHVYRSDTAADTGPDAQRSADPDAAGIKASLATQFTRTLRGSLRDEHHRRHGCDCHRVSSLSHARPHTTGETVSYTEAFIIALAD